MKAIIKLIDGKEIKCRPLPQFTDRSPLLMPFVDDAVMMFKHAQNKLIYVFTSKKCVNTVFIADCRASKDKYEWYSTKIANATSILKSNI